MDAFQHSALLRDLQPGSAARLASIGSRVDLKAGQQLFSVGDIGDAVYLIVEGHVAIYLTKPNQSELVLASLERGDLLGEDYLFVAEQPGRRSGSARAVDEVRLLRFPGPHFIAWLGEHQALHRRLRERQTERMQQNLRRRSQMFDLMCQAHPPDPSQHVQFSAGHVVFREGDVADAAYFVTAGQLVVHKAATPDVTLAQLGPGDVFGEAGVIRNQPRSASVQALDTVSAIKVAREDLAALYSQSSELRDMFAGLDFVYRLPNRGVSFNYIIRQGDHHGIERLSQLADGRRFLSTWLPGLKAFRLENLAETTPPTWHRWSDAGRSDSLAQERVVGLAGDGRIVTLVGTGIWTDLPWLLEHALDGTVPAPEVFTAFARTGRLSLLRAPVGQAAHETVCYCMQIKAHTLHEMIAAGHDSFDSLRQTSGCGSVCGGCQPTVLTMLGQFDWIPVLAEATPQTEDIRSFHLRPDMAAEVRWQTGQHLAISGRVDNLWVSRTYTITSAPGEGAELEIVVKREPQGLFSRWLFDGQPGEHELRIGPPRGNAVWTASARPAVCLVAGVGVTPALAIVRAATAQAEAVRVHVDYSGRHRAQMAFLGELEGHAGRDGRVTLEVRETAAGNRLDHAAVAGLVERFPQAMFYVCGPGSFMDAVVTALGQCGVPPEAIQEERFIHAGKPLEAQAQAQAVPVRGGFIRRAYLAGLGVAAAVLMLSATQSLEPVLPTGPPNTGHADLTCVSCHINAPGTTRQQVQAQVSYWLGQRRSSATFGHQPVGNAQCFDCHTRLRDSHSPHLFLEARYAEVRARLAPQLCVSCHTEHQGMRVSASNSQFCSHCHADMKLANDKLVPPASPTHAELTTQGRWDTCMGCHDYHGNHAGHVAPIQLSRAKPEAEVLSYFRGGASPYGDEIRTPARRPASAAQVKP